MNVTIPKKINVENLIKDKDWSKTRKKNMRDKIYYFLSLLTRTNDNVLFLFDDGKSHKKICSCIQKKIHGNVDYYIITEILTDKANPIIVKNKKWKKSSKLDGYCQGFKLETKYDTGETRTVRINKNLSNRIIENSKSDISKSYKFLTNQFNIHKITIDKRSEEYIRNYYLELKKISNNNEYTDKVIKNFVGRWLHYIRKIDNKEIWFRVSKENHRLNSTFTCMPKELRNFLLINGNPLEMIDIKSSQPYILSSIIKTRFFLENKNGYNLSTIHNKVHQQIILSSEESINFYINNHLITDNSPYKIVNTRSSSYMWCEFLNENEAQSVAEYGLYEFKKDFYQDIIDKNIADFDDDLLKNKDELRDKLKHVMMLILFDNNYQNRNNNFFINLFKKVYPGINKLIEKIHRNIGKNEFAYIMQRTESYLLLNNVSRKFNEKFQEAPIFTIHDALYTSHEYINDLNEIAANTLEEITRKMPGIKQTSSDLSVIPDASAVEKRWAKMKNINTKLKYEKIKHTILENNIVLAEQFIKTIQCQITPA